MFDFLNSLFDSNEKQIGNIRPIIDSINSFEDEMTVLSDDELRAKTDEFRERLGYSEDMDRGEDFDKEAERAILMELLPEAFAVVREAADRVVQHRHFEVQLMAGYFLANNNVIELFTGEGKTNSATLAMYLYALTGRGAHLVTVNDYLARRDGEWNGHVLDFLGMSVAILNNGVQYRFINDEDAIALKGEETAELIALRKEKQKEIGRLKLDLMDSVNLVECTKQEAYRCDLVYGTNNEFGFDYLRDNMSQRFADIVQERLHYTIVDEADSILIDEARTPLIISQGADGANDQYAQFARVVSNLQDIADYTIEEKDNSVIITDAGVDKVERLMKVDNIYDNPQMAYHLENALKAKELYKRDDEYIIRDGEIVIVDEFTGRAMPGRRYSEGLHQAIEAKEGVEVRQESKTLATITLQNYFRLYDHLAGMTGTAITEAEEMAKVYGLDVVVVPTNKPIIREDELDVIYRTEDAKFKAIVQDVAQASQKGQPVLVGTTSVERSETLSEMLAKEGVKHEVLNAKNHEREAKIVQHAGERGQVTIATNMAGRGTDIAIDDEVKELGGLYVIGSERHESRRIDNQLRGRSGRQGDPGRSKFFVSFEDELMRLFGGDRLKGVMATVGLDDDTAISMPGLGRSIENAQKKVEGHNFDIRKRLVDYDDVLNQQRDIVYSLRKSVLKIDKQFSGTKDGLSDKALKEFINSVDWDSLTENLDGFSLVVEDSYEIPEFEDVKVIDNPLHLWMMKRYLTFSRNTVSSRLADDMEIDSREERSLASVIASILGEEKIDRGSELLGYKDRVGFFKDFDKKESVADKESMVEKLVLTAYIAHCNKLGKKVSDDIARLLILQTIDQHWMQHLDSMADLREGIGMQGMAQRDPLVVYKNESFKLFETLLSTIDENVVKRFMRVRVLTEQEHRAAQAQKEESSSATVSGQSRKGSTASAGGKRASSPAEVSAMSKEKIGRNEPCPCGSGKKYKKCHIDRLPETAEDKAAFRLYFEDRDKWNEKFK